MRTLMQHVQLMISMDNNKIESKYITKFPLKEIVKCCKRIEKSELKSFNYNENDIITEELIRDENFMKYITLAYKQKYDIEKFVKLLEEIKLHNKSASLQ